MRKPILIVLLGVVVFPSGAGAQTYREQGIGLGGLTGAVIGGVIGHQNDEAIEGALIGGAVGAVAGGIAGRNRDYYENQAWSYHTPHAVPQVVSPSAVTPHDVIMLTRSGVSDTVIINHIRTKGVSHNLAVHDVISLHQQGVSEPVISALQTAPVAGTVVARPAPRSTVIVQPPCRAAYPHPAYRYHHHRRCW